jgi:hypothetical protein
MLENVRTCQKMLIKCYTISYVSISAPSFFLKNIYFRLRGKSTQVSCVCYPFSYPFSCSFNYPFSCSFLASFHGLVTVVIVKTINKEYIMKSWGRAVPSSDSNWHVSWGWANINNWIPDFGLTGEDIQLLSNLLFWFRHILLRLSSIDVVFLSKLPKIVLGFARVEIQSSSSIFPKNSIIFSLTSVDQQMIVSKFWSFPAISLLARVAVAQDMWWWLRNAHCAVRRIVVVVAQDMWWGKSTIKLTQPNWSWNWGWAWQTQNILSQPL